MDSSGGCGARDFGWRFLFDDGDHLTIVPAKNCRMTPIRTALGFLAAVSGQQPHVSGPISGPSVSLPEENSLPLIGGSARYGAGRIEGPAGTQIVGAHQGAVANAAQEIGLARFERDQATEDVEHVHPAFAFRRHSEAGRRFHLCRALAEVWMSPGSDALLTRAYSESQQRNRAFAAEFLAPSSGLRSRVSGSVVDGEDIDGLAAEFGVSSQVVEHQIANHHIARISRVGAPSD